MPNIVKNTTFPGFFSLLAPHSCRGCGRIGSPLCECCKNYIISNHKNICPVCHSLTPTGKCQKCEHLPPTFVVGNRSDLIGELIHDFKFQSLRALARPLAEILNGIIPDINSKSIIVPLPTISRHIRERGFSHTQLIARKFASIRSHCQADSILVRAKDTVQVGSSRDVRLAQASAAYHLDSRAKFNPDTTYIIFDDVWTTGASIQAAYSILKAAGAQKIIIAILALSTHAQSTS